MTYTAHPIDPSLCTGITAEWLVSVRDDKELATAIRFCVDVIDLKEPNRGPLAPVDVGLWEHAAELIDERAVGVNPAELPRLSAALGERDRAVAIASQLPKRFSFAKVGPSGCASARSIRRLWSDVGHQLPPQVELVAVAYADATAANCLGPEAVLREANQAGLNRCLIDTFTKDGRSSVQHLGPQRLAEFGQLAQQLQIWWALAGSITRHDVAALEHSNIKPNCFAIRGDVCSDDRTGTICEQRMYAWREMFAR